MGTSSELGASSPTPSQLEASPESKPEVKKETNQTQTPEAKGQAAQNTTPEMNWDDDPFHERGYGKLANLMALPDSDIAIFRKFGDATMLTLLGLQAEIVALRTRFWVLCESDERILAKNHGHQNTATPPIIPNLESFIGMKEEHAKYPRGTNSLQQHAGADPDSNGEFEHPGQRYFKAIADPNSNGMCEHAGNSRSRTGKFVDCAYCLLQEMRKKLKEYRSFLRLFPFTSFPPRRSGVK